MTTVKKGNTGLTIHKLVVKPTTRQVLDVGHWRDAMKAADRGKRERLYNLYRDVILDNVLGRAIEKRIEAITNAELLFIRDGKPVEEMDTLIDSTAFEELLTEIMNAKFWGISVIELVPGEDVEFYSIPREHIRVDLKQIVINPGDEQGIPYEDDDFLIPTGKGDMGLILRAAPYVIYKRGGFGDWAQFAELFGMPFKLGKYAGHDETTRKELEEALDRAGSSPWLVVPKESDVELKDGSGAAGGGDLFDKLRKACNEEILIGILGNTMTTVDGSSRSQSETHKEVEEGTNKADRRFVQRILNTVVLPRLEKRGYPVGNGYFQFTDGGENITLKEQSEIHATLINEVGLEIDEDWLHEFYSVPKAKVKKKTDPDPPKKEGKEGKEEKMTDDSFWDKMKGLFSSFQSAPAPERMTGACPECGLISHTEIELADIDGFNSEALWKRVAKGQVYFDSGLFMFTASEINRALDKGFLNKKFKAGIDYGYTPDSMKAAMEMNVFRFSAAKTLSEIQQLNQAFRVSNSFAEFSQKAAEISGKFNRAWLQTEYDSAVNTAQAAADFHRLRAQGDLFPFWEYRTAGDGKVRREHKEINGLILPYNDTAWNEIFPPNGWNCRCRVVPRTKNEGPASAREQKKKLREYQKTAEWKKAKAQGFGINKALSGEVFTENQFYIKKFPQMAAKYLDGINFKTFNLLTQDKYRANIKEALPAFSGKPDEWIKDNSNLKDYRNRTITLDSKLFVSLNKQAGKTAMLVALKETLAAPNETWLTANNKKEFNRIVMLRYYSNSTMVVIAEAVNGKYQVTDWLSLDDKAGKGAEDYRKGLLIHKK